jgi:hypothetical protein
MLYNVPSSLYHYIGDINVMHLAQIRTFMQFIMHHFA